MAGHRKLPGAEDIEWGGRRYRRYHNHHNRHQRTYYMATTAPRTYLHRDIYEAEVGPIPPGWHVHHIDHNPDNNAPDNLAAVDPSTHSALHGQHLREIDKICDECGTEFVAKREWARWCSPACKERRRREEGTAYTPPRKGPFRADRVCDECGIEFVTKRPWGIYCSAECRGSAGRRRRSGVESQR